MIDQLDRFITDAEHDIQRIEMQLIAARELRALLAEASPGSVVDPPPGRPDTGRATKPPKQTRASRKAAAAWSQELVGCPDCGKQMKAGGLGPHRAGKACKAAAEEQPTKVDTFVAPTPPSNAPTVKGKIFVCETCRRNLPSIKTLLSHVHDVHCRRLTDAERTPIDEPVAA